MVAVGRTDGRFVCLSAMSASAAWLGLRLVLPPLFIFGCFSFDGNAEETSVV